MSYTAIVTGAGSKRGIGRATAHALAAAGWAIAVLDLDEASAKDTAHEVGEYHGVQAVGVGCDVTDETSVEAALAALDGAVPSVGALVNNAGITSPTRFLDVTGAEWDRIFAVNVRGPTTSPAASRPGWPSRASAGSCSCRRCRPSAAAACSAGSPTPPPRPPSSGSPARWPASWARTGVTVTPSRPASSAPTSPAAPWRASTRPSCSRARRWAG